MTNIANNSNSYFLDQSFLNQWIKIYIFFFVNNLVEFGVLNALVIRVIAFVSKISPFFLHNTKGKQIITMETDNFVP